MVTAIITIICTTIIIDVVFRVMRILTLESRSLDHGINYLRGWWYDG